MIEVKFREPNFRAKVRESNKPEAAPAFRLLQADDAPSAQKYLESLGFEVLEVKPYDFKVWMEKATTARDEALTGYPKARGLGKSYEFDSEVWGQIKEHLQDLFQGRCAYCEAWFRSVSFGDVEHYRPKAAVTEDPNHPGYYWLAYDPANYLPACSICNTKGKKNRFPVKGARISDPGDDLGKEVPLLFNPYHDRHCDHVAYVPTTYTNHPKLVAGRAVGKSERGEISITSYELNRDPLVRERKRAQEHGLFKLREAMYNRNRAAILEILSNCLTGKEEFCTAVASEIDAYYKDMGLPTPFPQEINLGI